MTTPALPSMCCAVPTVPPRVPTGSARVREALPSTEVPVPTDAGWDDAGVWPEEVSPVEVSDARGSATGAKGCEPPTASRVPPTTSARAALATMRFAQSTRSTTVQARVTERAQKGRRFVTASLTMLQNTTLPLPNLISVARGVTATGVALERSIAECVHASSSCLRGRRGRFVSLHRTAGTCPCWFAGTARGHGEGRGQSLPKRCTLNSGGW